MACGSPRIRTASASFTRPADTNNYADNDLVANSTSAGSVVPMEFAIGVGNGRGIRIVGATIQKSGVAVTGATFELWLFGTTPTSTAGDNAAFATTAVDTAQHLGNFIFPAMAAYTNDARAMTYVGDQTGGQNPIFHYMSGESVIYGLLQTAAAYTDEASGETFTITLIYEQYE